MKEKIIHLLLIMFAGFLGCSVYFIMETVNMIECKTVKLERQQNEIELKQNEILYHMRDINEALNNGFEASFGKEDLDYIINGLK